MSVIDSKISNRRQGRSLFKIVRSARIFSAEFLLVTAALIAVIYFCTSTGTQFFIISFFVILCNGFLYVRIGKRRLSDIAEIAETISGIRKNVFTSPEDISLSSNLELLEFEIKEMFSKVQADIEYLRKLEKMRTGFLANVSHELKTPIFAMEGYLETLMNGALDDPKVNYHFLKKAHAHTLNLSTLVNDLIDISMIESGEMRMSFRYFSVNEYLSAVVSEFNEAAEKKGLRINFVSVREGLKLFGDKARIKQVMTNLIQNAIKYTESGEIEISVHEEKKWAEIRVRDTGIGIAAEDQERIFERFYRVDKARSREVGGTGLGLAIVKHIIEAHGESVSVKSEAGEGSTFSFKLKK